MLPFRATSGLIGSVGSMAVDGKTIVSASRNFAAPSSCVPKVSCVFLPVARSTRNSLSLPLTRAMYTRLLPSGAQAGAVVAELIVGDVLDLAAREVDGEDVGRRRCAAPANATVLPSGLNRRRLGHVDRLHVDALLDFSRQHVLQDERLLLFLAHEVRDAVAGRRPGHPRHGVAAEAAGRRDVLVAEVRVEAAGQVADDLAVLGRDAG